jgi:hypothetical protein
LRRLKNDAGDKLYLTVGQTDSDHLDGSAVPFDWLKRALEDSPARASLLVLDCCYSGTAAGIMSDGAVREWEIKVRGSAVLASSPRNRTSHSPQGHRHTAFTGKLIHLLRNGSPIEEEPLTVNTLYRRVSVALAKERFPEPKLALTETSGDLLVRRAPAPKPFVPDREPPTVRLSPVAPPDRPIPPVAPPPHPVPPTAPPAPVPQPKRSAKWTQLTGLRALWTLTAVFLAMGVGGLAGVVSGARRPDGTAGDDATSAWIGFVLAVVSGVPLWLMRGNWLSLRRELAPPLTTRSVVGRVFLLIGLAVCALMLVAAFASGKPSTTVQSDSDVVYTVALVLMAGEGAALCGYLLVSWWRTSRVGRRQAPDPVR